MHEAEYTDEFEEVPCNLCNSSEYSVVYKAHLRNRLKDSLFTPGIKIPHNEFCRVVKCLTCGLVYSSPRDNPISLYEKYAGDSEKDYLLSEKERILTFVRSVQLVQKYVQEGALLDIGCSCGLFLSQLPNAFESYGIEPSSRASHYARKKFGLNIIMGSIDTVDFPVNYFHAVTMWDVIEHLPSPMSSLEKIRKCMRKGAYIFIETPDIESIAVRIFGKYWHIFIRPHIYYFSRASIGLMLKKSGFLPIAFESHVRTLGLKYLVEKLNMPVTLRSFTVNCLDCFGLRDVHISVGMKDSFICIAKKI